MENDLMIVQPKETITINSMFYGYSTFYENQCYVAFKCDNIPNSEGYLYVYSYYDEEGTNEPHYKIAMNQFIVVEDENLEGDNLQNRLKFYDIKSRGD